METCTPFAAVRRSLVAGIAVLVVGLSPASAQVPQPFPRPGQPPPAAPQPSQPAPGQPVPQPAAPGSPSAADPAVGGPTEADLGVPIYPAAQFITSYDAGRGQRFYLFGVMSGFDEMVTYYRTILKDRGDRLYDSPPTHMFELGRFRDETMAFPPSVTVKDYTFGGSAGYPNPVQGVDPARYPTIIQVVPIPPDSPLR